MNPLLYGASSRTLEMLSVQASTPAPAKPAPAKKKSPEAAEEPRSSESKLPVAKD